MTARVHPPVDLVRHFASILRRHTPGRIRMFTGSLSDESTYREAFDGNWGSRCVSCDSFASVPQGHTPFVVLNRSANVVVRAVLSSPLHPLLSPSLALITVTGRRSGRRYTVPVAYRQDGDHVLINVGWPERKRWWRNLQDAAQVEMRIRGARRKGQASARGDERTGVTVEVQLDSGSCEHPA